MKPKQNPWLPLVLGAVGVYLVLFLAVRLPSVEQTGEGVFRRVAFLLCLVEPGILLDGWFGDPPELSILDRLPVLGIAAGMLAYAFTLGWLLMAWLRLDRPLSRLEVLVFSTAVGLSVVSTYVLLAGLFGLLRNLWVFAVAAALTLAAAGRLRWRRKTAGEPQTAQPKKKTRRSSAGPGADAPDRDDWLSLRWLWLGAPFVLAILLGSMIPPVEFDVREYHLQVPKEFFQEGRIGFLPHNVYGNMAMGTEMLSLLAMVLADDWWLGALAGKTVIGAFAPLTALGLLAAGRRFLSPAAGVVAAVVYISTPWIAQVSANGLVEGAAACYLFLAVYAVLLYQASRRHEPADGRDPSGDAAKTGGSHAGLAWLVLAGYLAGGAVSTKYPAALFVFLPLAVWVLLVGWRPRWQDAWKPVGVFVLAAAVGCGLWFGKNWALTGNPTYPLLDNVFHSPQWSAEKNARWNQAHRPHDFSPAAAWDAARLVALRSEWLSPLLMPLAALALLGAVLRPGGKGADSSSFRENRGRPPLARGLVVSLAVYVAYVLATWWLLTHRIDRFWIPVLPLVALLAGQGALWSEQRTWRRALVALLVFTSLINLLVVTSGAGGYNGYFVGLGRLRGDLVRTLNPWHAYFNAHAKGGRVLLVGDAQPFDLEVPVLYNTVFDDCVFEQMAAGRSPHEIQRVLVERGITHVYVDWGEIRRYRKPDNYGFTDFVQPEVFDTLVGAGVLRPLRELKGHAGRAYRVVWGGAGWPASSPC